MKIEIIPTILVPNFNEVKAKIKAVENYVDWAQMDIMDGIFVKNKTWPYSAKASKGKNNPNDLKNFKTKVKLEAHLMVEKPEEVIDDWLEVVERVIVHYEASNNLENLIKKVHQRGKGIGLAINPETSIEAVKPFLKDLDLVLCMAVQPGWGGQELRDEVLAKIRALRKLWPDGKIEVDGGITDKNIEKVIKAGANLICVGTYIFKSKDIKQAIENLKK
jgi:ribulose-phosphate 3-epimerase